MMKNLVIALLTLVSYTAQATGVPTPVGGTYVNGALCNVLDLNLLLMVMVHPLLLASKYLLLMYQQVMLVVFLVLLLPSQQVH